MGEAKPLQSGGTAGRISLMSSLPVDETARAHENRRHCSRPYFAPYLPGVLRLRDFEFVLTSDTLSHCKAYLMCGFPFILFEKFGQFFHVQF